MDSQRNAKNAQASPPQQAAATYADPSSPCASCRRGERLVASVALSLSVIARFAYVRLRFSSFGTKEKDEMSNSSLGEEAERFYQRALQELQSADSSIKATSQLFEELLNLLRELGKLNDKLSAIDAQNAVEKERLANQLAELSARLQKLVQQLPSGVLPAGTKASGDPSRDVNLLFQGVSNMLNSLRMNAASRKMLEEQLTKLREEAEMERKRWELLKKVIQQAEAMMKEIVGDTSGSLVDMVIKLRQLVENERQGKLKLRRKQEYILKASKELKTESEDLSNLLVELFEKCGVIERAVTELDVKAEKAPTYSRDGDESEQFTAVSNWLISLVSKLLDEQKESQECLADVEDQQKKLDALCQQKADELKREVAKTADLQGKLKNLERQLYEKKRDADVATKVAEELQPYLVAQLNALKQSCDEEQARLSKAALILRQTLDELNKSLNEMKSELSIVCKERETLDQRITEVLKELGDVQRQYSDDARMQQQYQASAGEEEKQLKDRLKNAERAFKNADDKRRRLADDLRAVKNQSGNVTDKVQELEDKLFVYKEEHAQALEEISRRKAKVAQLAEEAEAGGRRLKLRDGAIEQLMHRQAAAKDKIKELEKALSELRSGDAVSDCANCEGGDDPTPLKAEIERLRVQRDDLLACLERENEEIKELEKRPKSPARERRSSSRRSRRRSGSRSRSRSRPRSQSREIRKEEAIKQEAEEKRAAESLRVELRGAARGTEGVVVQESSEYSESTEAFEMEVELKANVKIS